MVNFVDPLWEQNVYLTKYVAFELFELPKYHE